MKNKIKLFFLLSTLICLFGVLTLSANADTVINAEVIPTDFDALSVEFSGGATYLTSTQFTLTYDSAVLEYVEDSETVTSARTAFASVQKVKDGELLVGFFADTHAYKSDMCKIDFKVLDTNSTSYGFDVVMKNVYVSKDNTGADSSVLDNGSMEWTIPAVVNLKYTIDPSEVFYSTDHEGGITFDTLQVFAVWSNGTTVEVPADAYTVVAPPFSFGFKTVNIKFKNLTTSYSIAVGIPLPEHIKIEEYPAKQEYLQDSVEAFDTTGLVVMAYYPEQDPQWVKLDSDEYSIEGFDTSVKFDNPDQDSIEQTVYVKAYNREASLTITINADKPASIAIKKNPDMLIYKQGSVDEIMLSGIEVEASFADGRKKTVGSTDEELVATGFNPSKLGEQTITLSYRGVKTTFKVTVEPLVIRPEYIEITALPVQLAYFQNTQDKFVTTGLKVKCVYADNQEENLHLNDIEITGFNPAVVGKQTITVHYFELTDTFEIEIIKEPDPTDPISIAIIEQPVKREYMRNSKEELDLTGLVVNATLGTGDVVEVPIAELDVTGFDLTEEDEMQFITITYKGCSTAFFIMLIENTEILYGDVDNDGELTASDARLALRYSVSLESGWTPDKITRADWNKDGSVTSSDARSILRISVGLDG